MRAGNSEARDTPAAAAVFSLSLEFMTAECRVRARPFPATSNSSRKSQNKTGSFWREMFALPLYSEGMLEARCLR